MTLLQRPEVRRLLWQCGGALILAIAGYLGLQWLPGQKPSKSPGTVADGTQAINGTGVTSIPVAGQPAVSQTPRLPDDREAREMQIQLAETQRELLRLRSQIDEAKASVIASRAEATQLVATGREVQTVIDSLNSDRKQWLSNYASLLTDDRGRCIAASESHIGLALSILTKQRIDDSTISGWRTALTELVVPLEASLKNSESAVSLSPQVSQQLLAISQNVRTELQVLRDDMLILDGLIETTKTLQPAELTLTQVDSNQKLAAAELKDKTERDRNAKDVSASLALQSEMDEKRRKHEAEIAAAEEAARRAKEKLKQEFDRDYAKIKGRLVAFTSEGMELRGKSTGKGPVSLSLMQGRGALERSEGGRQKIAIVVGESRRDSGGLMKFQGGQSEQQMADFDTVQEFLIKYGELMVEQGLLAP